MDKQLIFKYCCIIVGRILIFVIGGALKKSQNEYRKGMLKTILMQQTGAESVNIEVPGINSSPEDWVFEVKLHGQDEIQYYEYRSEGGKGKFYSVTK